ncbi:hypothetical protein [Streptomyces sp. NPDC092952]
MNTVLPGAIQADAENAHYRDAPRTGSPISAFPAGGSPQTLPPRA